MGENRDNQENNGKTREYSIRETLVETIHPVTPAHANPLGIVHGGVVLEWMVDAATVAAMRLARGPAVLAGMDHVFFLNPIRLGWNALVTAWVSLIGRSSMEVTVLVRAHDPRGGETSVTTASHMTLVSVDEHLRPRPVGAVIAPNGPLEEELYQEARKRRSERQKRRSKPSPLLESNAPGYSTTLFLVNPQDTLAYDVLHARRLLRVMDELAGIASGRIAGGPTVTAAIDAMDFHTPVWRGEIVEVRAGVTGVGRTSMEVAVEAWAQRPGEQARLATTSYFTMVHIGEEGRPEPVPQQIVEAVSGPSWESRRKMRMERLDFMKKIIRKLRPPGRGL